MIGRVIIIGDSHIVPLKKAFESLNLDGGTQYHFLPFKYIKAASPNFIVNHSLEYKKILDQKSHSFYSSSGFDASDDSDKIHRIPLENSKVYLVGMGLGMDAFLRNFSEDGTLNHEKCVDIPIYSSQAVNYCSATNLLDFTIYQDDFIDDLIGASIQKSKSFKLYKNFIEYGFSSIELLPLPFVSFSSLAYYSRSDLNLIPSELYLYSINKWLDCISTVPAIINPFKLIAERHLSKSVLLMDGETYSSKPSDIHMSIKSCEMAINYIHASLSS